MLSNLKESHAFGIDKLDAATMKMAKLILAAPIAYVINLSLQTRTFPQRWKLSRVLPLLKSTESDSFSPSGYRPVSQLPVISKLAERTVQLQLLEYLESSGQISQDHHAYRKHTSTTTALLKMCEIIAQGAEENSITATMNIDQTAAFDSVEHDILLLKLKYYNIGDETIDWIRSYLHCRSSFVAIGSAQSHIYKNTYGVPQGSCLGPLLYLIYVNEFSTVVREDDCTDAAHDDSTKLFGKECPQCGKLTIFADDAQYSNVSKNRRTNQERIEMNFIRIFNFLNSCGLEVNQSKTSLTEYMTRQKRVRMPGDPPQLTVVENIDGTFVEKCVTDKVYSRILGGNIRNDLTWTSHLSTGKRALLPAVRKQLGALHSLRQSLSMKAKLQLANSFILSRLNYIISLWGNTTTNQIRKAQVCLNASARFVLTARKSTRQSELMSRCNWLNVRELTEFHSLLQLWKLLRWNLPRSLTDTVELVEDDLVSTRRARIKLTDEAWRNATVRRWNDLPEFLRSELSIGKFKRSLKRHIKERRTRNLEPD